VFGRVRCRFAAQGEQHERDDAPVQRSPIKPRIKPMYRPVGYTFA
jgi:hypothetical protein